MAARFEDHGSLSHQHNNNFYEKTFKIACVRSVIKKRLYLSEAATCFGIFSDSTIVQWMKLYCEFGEEGPERTKVGRKKACWFQRIKRIIRGRGVGSTAEAGVLTCRKCLPKKAKCLNLVGTVQGGRRIKAYLRSCLLLCISQLARSSFYYYLA